MSYTVLARRYRSATFDDLVGQGHIAQTLKRAIETSRIAHAYLFVGTRGTGKTSTARILAKALNCESSDKPTPVPCGKCTSCLAIARGEDMDVIEIDAASHTGVDNVRDLIIANANTTPARSRFKIFIIDEVHMLSRGAFNALLKTLEEPPAHVKFILATTEAEKVPTTILSRCQRYDFRNIPGREIADHLREICTKEKIEADDDALLMVARAGAGSMRDSLSLLDRLFSVGEKRVTVELIEQLLGLPKAQAVYELTQAIGSGKVGEVLQRVDSLITSGLSAESLLAALIDHLRNLLLVRTCGIESKLVEAVGVPPKDLAQQAQNFDPVSLTQDITLLEELRRQIRTAHAGRALLDASLVRLALAEQFTAIDQLLAQQSPGASPAAPVQKKKPELAAEPAWHGLPARGEKDHGLVASGTEAPPVPKIAAEVQTSIAAAPTIEAAPPADEDDDLPRPGKVWDNSGPSLSELLKQQSPRSVAATAATPISNVEPVSLTNLPKVWKDFLAHLTAKKELGIYGMLSQGRLTAIEGGQAIIKFANEMSMKMADRRRDQVLSHFGEFSQQAMGVRFEVDTTIATTPAPSAAAPAPSRPTATPKPAAPSVQHLPPLPGPTQVKLTPELMEKLQEVPLVKGVMEQLGGTIVRVTEEN